MLPDCSVKDVPDRSYREGPRLKERKFSMGKGYDIVVGEEVKEINGTQERNPKTIVRLVGLKKGPAYEKQLPSIGRNLVERLLPYFITENYVCPNIILSEYDGNSSLCLNDFVNNEVSAYIQEIGSGNDGFKINRPDNVESFLVRVFKLYAPKNHKSRVSLVAHQREVSGSVLQKYIPEFEEEFYESSTNQGFEGERNYIIKAYVFGPYLDCNVSVERGGFEFGMESELLLGISQADIEKEAAEIARESVGANIRLRQERKRDRVQSYVDEEAPWHKTILKSIDLKDLPYNPTNEEIEARLQGEKFSQEATIKKDVSKLLAEADFGNVRTEIPKIVSKISDTSKDNLIHYIVLRKKILDIFGKSLQLDESGGYSSEGVVHDIVFPRKGDTEITSFEDHNLWIVDERLNFTTYVSSDVPLGGENPERPDLVVYNRRVLFRGDNQESNPITIFEFKKPQRDDFVNPSSPEDPVQQIVRYVNDIRDGKYKTPSGRNIMVGGNTPFYGYVVCDLNQKIENWLEREKDFKPMPDRLGWFQWIANINLYVEVICWDKILRDAQMRNEIFFQKLGI